MLFVITAYYDLDINQRNIKTTFLYGIINQLVHVQIPKDLVTNVDKKMICKLLKTLYSLKQALRVWYKRLFKFLDEKPDLRQINTNYNIFVISVIINCPIVSTFINEINVIDIKYLDHIERVKQELVAILEIVDMRLMSFYLDLKVERDFQKKC